MTASQAGLASWREFFAAILIFSGMGNTDGSSNPGAIAYRATQVYEYFDKHTNNKIETSPTLYLDSSISDYVSALLDSPGTSYHSVPGPKTGLMVQYSELTSKAIVSWTPRIRSYVCEYVDSPGEGLVFEGDWELYRITDESRLRIAASPYTLFKVMTKGVWYTYPEKAYRQRHIVDSIQLRPGRHIHYEIVYKRGGFADSFYCSSGYNVSERVALDGNSDGRVDFFPKLISSGFSAKIGAPVVLRANIKENDSDDPLIYNWDFGDGSAPVNTNVSFVEHHYESPGRYTATLSVSQPDGFTEQQETEVTVYDPVDLISIGSRDIIH